jgi:hypothetical protein
MEPGTAWIMQLAGVLFSLPAESDGRDFAYRVRHGELGTGLDGPDEELHTLLPSAMLRYHRQRWIVRYRRQRYMEPTSSVLICQLNKPRHFLENHHRQTTNSVAL